MYKLLGVHIFNRLSYPLYIGVLNLDCIIWNICGNGNYSKVVIRLSISYKCLLKRFMRHLMRLFEALQWTKINSSWMNKLVFSRTNRSEHFGLYMLHVFIDKSKNNWMHSLYLNLYGVMKILINFIFTPSFHTFA